MPTMTSDAISPPLFWETFIRGWFIGLFQMQVIPATFNFDLKGIQLFH